MGLGHYHLCQLMGTCWDEACRDCCTSCRYFSKSMGESAGGAPAPNIGMPGGGNPGAEPGAGPPAAAMARTKSMGLRKGAPGGMRGGRRERAARCWAAGRGMGCWGPGGGEHFDDGGLSPRGLDDARGSLSFFKSLLPIKLTMENPDGFVGGDFGRVAGGETEARSLSPCSCFSACCCCCCCWSSFWRAAAARALRLLDMEWAWLTDGPHGGGGGGGKAGRPMGGTRITSPLCGGRRKGWWPGPPVRYGGKPGKPGGTWKPGWPGGPGGRWWPGYGPSKNGCMPW